MLVVVQPWGSMYILNIEKGIVRTLHYSLEPILSEDCDELHLPSLLSQDSESHFTTNIQLLDSSVWSREKQGSEIFTE